jgi:uncharacterized membrane protein YkvI
MGGFLMKKNWKIIGQIAATYIGTVVGAGFATGQEIIKFFTNYGLAGLLAILVSTALFIWLGTKMMILSRRIQAYSYQELNFFLFGRKVGWFINLLTLLILFGVTSVMLSGTGSIFEEQLGLSFQLGIIFTIILCYLVITKGLNGILGVNSLVVPSMLMFSILIGTNVWNHGDITSLLSFDQLTADTFSTPNWLFSALTYVAFNLAMAQAVLVPLGKEVDDEKLLKWGGIWGGIGLGFMLICSHFALHSMMPGISKLQIPMGELIKGFGSWVHILFLFVIYGEIFTTLIGNVFGISRQVISKYDIPEKWLVIMILLASFLISQMGFGFLLSYLYPIFGYMALILILFLAIKQVPSSSKEI